MNKYHPQSWHVVIWLVFVIWLTFSVWANVPFDTAGGIETKTATQTQTPATGMSTGVVTQQSVIVGWPIFYMETKIFQNAPSVSTFNTMFLVANVLLIMLNQFAIVHFFQSWMPRFSIRAMFFATAMVAVIIFIGQFALTSNSFYRIFGYLMALYFAPTIGCVVMWCFDKFIRRQIDDSLENSSSGIP